MDTNALASLRRYIRPRAARPVERCGLCDATIAPEHAHLLEPATGALVCGCEPCALLFSGRADGRYRPVPRGVRSLGALELSDAAWDAIGIPIDLAFFVHSTRAGGVVAYYPSPAGATEALVPPEAWQALLDDNPALAGLEPDVEALLVNRVAQAREYYRVGIDECYRLVGIIRTRWRGLSGGREVWTAIGTFFDEMRRRSDRASTRRIEGSHA